jgi:hypothetical protein
MAGSFFSEEEELDMPLLKKMLDAMFCCEITEHRELRISDNRGETVAFIELNRLHRFLRFKMHFRIKPEASRQQCLDFVDRWNAGRILLKAAGVDHEDGPCGILVRHDMFYRQGAIPFNLLETTRWCCRSFKDCRDLARREKLTD